VADRSYLSIGQVLDLLKREFPDLTISKIRFLESQGLLDPERTPSGYRKFYEADIERLRFILREQQENYLPLKVIKGRLGGEADGEDDGEPGGGEAGELEPALAGASVAAASTHADAGALVVGPSARGDRPAGSGAGVASTGGRGPAPRAGSHQAGSLQAGSHQAGSHQAGEPVSSGPASSGPATVARERPAEPAPAARGVSAHPAAGPGATTAAPATAAPAAPAAAGPGTARSGTAARPAGSTTAGSATGAAGSASRPGRAGRDGEPTRPSPPATPPPATPPPADPPPSGPPPSGPPAAGRQPSTVQTPARSEAGREGGGSPPAEAAGAAGPGPLDLLDAGGEPVSLTLEELAAASGLSPAEVTDLERFGLIAGRKTAGTAYYDQDCLQVAGLAAGFRGFGVEARHLRMYRTAVEREAGFFEQVVTPMLKQRNPQARRQAVENLAELARLGQAMRAAILRQALREYTDGH